MTNPEEDSSPRRLMAIAAALLVVCALYFGRELLIPLAVATFIAFLLVPLVRLLERRRLGRVTSVMLVVGLLLGAVFSVGWVVLAQAATLAGEIPKYRENLVSKIRDVRSTTDERVQRASRAIEEISEALEAPTSAPATGTAPAGPEPPADPQAEVPVPGPVQSEPPEADDRLQDAPNQESGDDDDPEPVKVEVVPSKPEILRQAGDWIAPVLHPFATAGITLVFVVFFLIHREDLRDRFLRICGRAHINVTTAALAESASRVTRYLSALALVNTITGFAIAIGLYFIGVPNAALWGLLAGVLRFVPFLGPWLAALFPLAVSLALLESWAQPILVALLFILVEALCANLLEPWFYGARMGVSPVAVLFSFVFWTWMWGPVGLFLALPITVCLVVLGKHTPAFEIFYIMLGDEPVLEPATRFYQRLLATDRDEARKIAAKVVQDPSFAAGADTTLLPALGQIEQDYREDLVDERRLEFVRETMEEIAGLDGEAETSPDEAPPEPARHVLIVPVEGALSKSAAQVLAAALHPEVGAEVIAERALRGRLAGETGRDPHALVLVAVEPRRPRRLVQVCERVMDIAPGHPVFALVATAGSPASARRERGMGRPGRRIRVFQSAETLRNVLAD